MSAGAWRSTPVPCPVTSLGVRDVSASSGTRATLAPPPGAYGTARSRVIPVEIPSRPTGSPLYRTGFRSPDEEPHLASQHLSVTSPITSYGPTPRATADAAPLPARGRRGPQHLANPGSSELMRTRSSRNSPRRGPASAPARRPRGPPSQTCDIRTRSANAGNDAWLPWSLRT